MKHALRLLAICHVEHDPGTVEIGHLDPGDIAHPPGVPVDDEFKARRRETGLERPAVPDSKSSHLDRPVRF